LRTVVTKEQVSGQSCGQAPSVWVVASAGESAGVSKAVIQKSYGANPC
jgi:hypothetical protein